MKKNVFRFVLLMAVSAFLSSCFSIPKTFKFAFDENSPVEKNAIVTFVSDTRNGYFMLNEWNAIEIRETLYGGKNVSSVDKAAFTVPSGANEFKFNMRFTFSSQSSSRTYRIEDIGIRYTLGAGEKYEIKGRYESLGFLGFEGLDFYVGIYNVTNRSRLLEEWKVGSTKKQEDK